MGWLWEERRRGVWQGRACPGPAGLAGVATPTAHRVINHPTRPRTVGWVKGRVGAEGLTPTGIVASDARGASEDLPQQCRVLPAVLNEHVLQSLCPVEFIKDDSGCGGGRGLAGKVPGMSPR